MDSIKQTVARFVRDNFYIPEGDAIADDASLRDLGVVDSTGVLEVVSFLEGKYTIRIEDAELLPENLDSIDAIARFVDKKLAGAAGRVA